MEMSLVATESGVADDTPANRPQPTPPPNPRLVLVDTCLSLVVCGHAGVLIRFWLGHDCKTSWSASVICGPFADLPANLIGCFVMGLLCDGKTCAKVLRQAADELTDPARAELEEMKKLPLPLAPGLRKGMPVLLLGLRTGFCGSLTTYASWSNAMVGDIA